jgi:hypothetical protein
MITGLLLLALAGVCMFAGQRFHVVVEEERLRSCRRRHKAQRMRGYAEA